MARVAEDTIFEEINEQCRPCLFPYLINGTMARLVFTPLTVSPLITFA